MLIFIIVILAAFIGGALLAYPLFRLLSVFTEVAFSDSVIIATQLSGLLLSLFYLGFTDRLNTGNLGYVYPDKRELGLCACWFVLGLVIILLLAFSLGLAGLYSPHPGREITFTGISMLFLGAFVTGFAVSLFEETVFRGALLRGLQKTSGASIAILASAFVYACVHFIDYPPTPAEPGFFTAISQITGAYAGIFQPHNYDAFAALFVLGVLLGLMRVRHGNILVCIGLHAGLVAGIKLFRYFLIYVPGTESDFLASQYDHRLGVTALFWLGLLTAVYYGLTRKKTRKASTNPG